MHALVRLLDNVLEYAREPQRSVWVREVLALLYPLVRRSRMVARLLVRALPGQTIVDAVWVQKGLMYLMLRLLRADKAPPGSTAFCARDGYI